MEKTFKNIEMDNPYVELGNTLIGFVGGSIFLMGQVEPILSSLAGSVLVSFLLAGASYLGQLTMKKLDRFLESKWKNYKNKFKIKK